MIVEFSEARLSAGLHSECQRVERKSDFECHTADGHPSMGRQSDKRSTGMLRKSQRENDRIVAVYAADTLSTPDIVPRVESKE